MKGTVSLVYPTHADAAGGKVSVLAPVGIALFGLSEGQSIEWDFPDGSRRLLKPEELLHQPERSGNIRGCPDPLKKRSSGGLLGSFGVRLAPWQCV